MKLAILAERVGNDWTFSILPPQLRSAIDLCGRRTTGGCGSAAIFVSSPGRKGCEAFEPVVHFKQYAPDR